MSARPVKPWWMPLAKIALLFAVVTVPVFVIALLLRWIDIVANFAWSLA